MIRSAMQDSVPRPRETRGIAHSSPFGPSYCAMIGGRSSRRYALPEDSPFSAGDRDAAWQALGADCKAKFHKEKGRYLQVIADTEADVERAYQFCMARIQSSLAGGQPAPDPAISEARVAAAKAARGSQAKASGLAFTPLAMPILPAPPPAAFPGAASANAASASADVPGAASPAATVAPPTPAGVPAKRSRSEGQGTSADHSGLHPWWRRKYDTERAARGAEEGAAGDAEEGAAGDAAEGDAAAAQARF